MSDRWDEEFEAHARRTDPETSHEAADSLGKQIIRFNQQGVLTIFRRHGPMCDQEFIKRYNHAASAPTLSAQLGLLRQSESGLRTRRSELVAMGLIEDSGEKATLPSGRRSIIWRITPKPTV